MGFEFPQQPKRNLTDVYVLYRDMLMKYKELYGDMLVPSGFVMPSNNSTEWPESMWQCKLYIICSIEVCTYVPTD